MPDTNFLDVFKDADIYDENDRVIDTGGGRSSPDDAPEGFWKSVGSIFGGIGKAIFGTGSNAGQRLSTEDVYESKPDNTPLYFLLAILVILGAIIFAVTRKKGG